MAFKRNGFSSLVSTKKETFGSAYKFSKKVKFEVGHDAYIIPLGLEEGFYETPCHAISPHKVDNQLIGFNGTNFRTYIKCEGCDEEGNKTDSLCCELAKLEKERFPEKTDSAKRIVSFTTSRIHLPVLVLGNSLNDDSKVTYPVSKIAILKDLKSKDGLKFAYIDMAASSFKQEILEKYGKQLKDEGILDYDLEETGEEFYTEVCKRLSNTVIRVHGVSKQGFSAALKEYSFFSFDNPAVASGSGAEEKAAITGYRKNKEIMSQINQFMTLFNIEVDNLIPTWNAKDLQEYYNSAIGADLKAPIKKEAAPVEAIEMVEEVAISSEPIEITEEESALLAAVATSGEMETEPEETTEKEESWEEEVASIENKVDEATSTDDFEFDSEDGDDFFED